MKSSVGENIKRIRKKLGYTQGFVAEKLFTTAQNISRVESGEGEPTAEMLINLADFFKVSVDTLLGRDNPSRHEIMNRNTGFFRYADRSEVHERIMSLGECILKGRLIAAIGEDIQQSATENTYSTLTAKGMIGVYANREDCPKILSVTETENFGFEESEAAILEDIFGALSKKGIISLLCELKSDMCASKCYDRESFCKRFDIRDGEFEKTVDILKKCGCIEIKAISIDSKEMTVYRAYATREAVMLLQIAKLLFLRNTDGNV